MKKAFGWIGIVLSILVILAIILAGSMFFLGSSKLTETYSIQPVAVTIPEDENTIERGGYIYAASCDGCHGDGLRGKAILDDPAIGYLPAPNLTAGQGGDILVGIL